MVEAVHHFLLMLAAARDRLRGGFGRSDGWRADFIGNVLSGWLQQQESTAA